MNRRSFLVTALGGLAAACGLKAATLLNNFLRLNPHLRPITEPPTQLPETKYASLK